MTLSPEVLSGLRERIKAATGSDAELDIDLCIALSYIGYTDAPERLREMLAACEGVTPGPWELDETENRDDRGKFTS